MNRYIILLLSLFFIFQSCKDEVKPPVDTTGRYVIFGANTNHWQPIDKQTRFQGVRYYCPIGWSFRVGGWRGQPMYQGQKQFMGIDDYLNALNQPGTDALLCLMQSPDWINGYDSGELNTNDFPPIGKGLDRRDPKSYSTVASVYAAYAKRYGSITHPYGSYRIDPTLPRWRGDGPQEYKSGLNLVKYIEVGNEFDRWWKVGTSESAQYMNAEEHAALLICAYDSIKAADPGMKVVMAGLTNFHYKYLKQMNDFCKSRGRSFPSDAINVHHYSNSGNRTGVHPPTWNINGGVAPELDPDIISLDSVVEFANTLRLPVWVTEFGYDTEQGSPMAPTTFDGITSTQLADQWNVRTALEYVRRGAHRCYVFNIADEAGSNIGLYQSSGLLKGDHKGYEPKPGFASYAMLCDQTRGCKYIADESRQDIRIMRFKSPNDENIIAYWSPTASGKRFGAVIAGQNVIVTESVQYTDNEK